MKVRRARRFGVLGCATALLAVAVALAAATSADAAGLQTCDASAYTLALRSLTGLGGADLAIVVSTNVQGCELPETLGEVRVDIRAYKKSTSRQLDVKGLASPGGAATLHLPRVVRHQRLAATVSFDPDVVLAGQTRTFLRPDLVVRAATTPRVALTGRTFKLGVKLGEPNPDIGATATVTVSTAGTVLATVVQKIAPRRRAVLQIPVALPAPGRSRLIVSVTSDLPETSTRNNARTKTVEVTDFAVVRSTVLVSSLAGYGTQFNHHVYAAISRTVGVTDENVGDMERKMRDLHPEFSRIFFSPTAFSDPDRMQSFVRAVLLAQSTGTTINITWQGGALTVRSGTVQKFANVLIDLVRNRGVKQIKWLTLQNEPNRTKITPQQYEQQYRDLDPFIQSIRGQVKYMGGDLVRGPDTGAPDQDVWFSYLATHMADILDAYSIHVFWDYWDTQKLQDRLTEVRAIVDALPESGRKPLYVAEYGVRGLPKLNDVKQVDPGVWTDGTPISRTNISAFQHAWFDVLSSKLGYVGTSKWDGYFAKYDAGTQAYYMIGSPTDGWPLYPLYNFVHLMTSTVKPGWKVVGVDSVAGTSRLVTAYFGPKGQRTIVGLDTAGAQLNADSSASVPYSVSNLPASRRLHLVVWNEAGDGLTGRMQGVTTDDAGVASFAVPQHAVFALTTETLPSR